MEATEGVCLNNAIHCINTFLQSCNLEKIEFNPSGANLTIDLTKAIGELSKKLEDIANGKDPLPDTDPSIIQITATNEQLNERIHAFMAHAQNVVDGQNMKEFCSNFTTRDSQRCARIDSCYKRRSTHTTHMKVSKASNVDGPRLKVIKQGLWRSPAKKQTQIKFDQEKSIPHPIAERLTNLETHLDIQSVESDIYTRLKNLENRLLAIEGISPEYFSGGNEATMLRTQPKRMTQSDPRNFTLLEIDDRIRTLKQELCLKKRKLDEGLGLL